MPHSFVVGIFTLHPFYLSFGKNIYLINIVKFNPLPTDEIGKLLKVCPEHLKPIVITALNTGMRKQEILRLK